MDTQTQDKIRGLISSAETSIKEAKEDAIKARKAGINVDPHESRIRSLQAKITQLKAVYG